MRGDVLSPFGRFAPLTPDHPTVGDLCSWCGQLLEAGQHVSLVENAPASPDDEARAAGGRAHNVEARVVHESCAYPDGAA